MDKHAQWIDHRYLFDGITVHQFEDIPVPVRWDTEDGLIVLVWKDFYCTIDPFKRVVVSDYRRHPYTPDSFFCEDYKKGIDMLIDSLNSIPPTLGPLK